ncbi:MAG: 50S ribosomal protein L4 [Actinomycetota bacterium]|nr:50S ribosomal protein L4 [Actinomycetota bacterium]
MPKIFILDPAGRKTGSRDLPADVFDAPVNVPLMHQVVVAGLAGLRAGTHSTKTRGEVSGGGKKPWRQKGTGRARQGSSRSPQWVGGGISHGPIPRGHEMHVNKKMKKGALRGALTDSLRSGKIVVVSELGFDEPKTRDAVTLLEALELRGKVLIVLRQPTDTGGTEKSFRNLQNVKMAYAGGLGVYDLLLADRIVFTDDALDALVGGADSGSKVGAEKASRPAGRKPATKTATATTDEMATSDAAPETASETAPGVDGTASDAQVNEEEAP